MERANSAFVFVTPRNYPGKTAWEKRKNEAGDWKAVRFFDASDLEQWLEQSVPAQIWLAEQLAVPVSGYETLEQAWRRWAHASAPHHLTPEIFAPSIAAHHSTLKAWLDKPSNRPFVVAADSRDEALAFLACLFDDAELRQFNDIAAVFTSLATLRTLLAPRCLSSRSSIPKTPSANSLTRISGFIASSSVPGTRSIGQPTLRSTCSATTLSRRPLSPWCRARRLRAACKGVGPFAHHPAPPLSNNGEIRTPAWAAADDKAKTLVPMALIGVWHAEPEADREIISYVADRKYEAIEDDIASLLQFDDSPVWSAGRYRGVASKIDALFAIARMVTPPDLDRFFEAAEYVLSESDPALELPEEDRRAAALYGKKRDHSGALREGICETLVILSVHGNNLFQSRFGIDVEARVAVLIRKLLKPLTLEKLLSHDHDLSRYAEAAPDEFLRIVEEDLRRNNPVVFRLLKPVNSGSFGASPSRTGLLWALECLAWKPQNLPRVSTILAQLSRPKIDDNWMNKPDASLQAIFRSWMPQTAASVEQRIKALEMLIRRFPEVGWEICIEQIKPGSRIGFHSYRPRWRSDASGAGQVVTDKQMYDFDRKALDLLLAWRPRDEKTLCDLVESLECMPNEDQTRRRTSESHAASATASILPFSSVPRILFIRGREWNMALRRGLRGHGSGSTPGNRQAILYWRS